MVVILLVQFLVNSYTSVFISSCLQSLEGDSLTPELRGFVPLSAFVNHKRVKRVKRPLKQYPLVVFIPSTNSGVLI